MAQGRRGKSIEEICKQFSRTGVAQEDAAAAAANPSMRNNLPQCSKTLPPSQAATSNEVNSPQFVGSTQDSSESENRADQAYRHRRGEAIKKAQEDKEKYEADIEQCKRENKSLEEDTALMREILQSDETEINQLQSEIHRLGALADDLNISVDALMNNMDPQNEVELEGLKAEIARMKESITVDNNMRDKKEILDRKATTEHEIKKLEAQLQALLKK